MIQSRTVGPTQEIYLVASSLFKTLPVLDASGAHLSRDRAEQISDIARILSRARREDRPHRNDFGGLMALFGYDTSDDMPPIAPFTYYYDLGSAPETFVMRADPVQLQADRDRVVLVGGMPPGLDLHWAQALAEEVRVCFPASTRLEVPHPSRWYLHLPADPRIRTRSPDALLGQDVYDFMPEGPEGLEWRRLMNEVQTALYQAEINRSRRAQGRPWISSLWFWGGGRLPAPSPSPWRSVWTDDALVSGLALAGGCEARPAPGVLARCLETLGEGRHLFVFPQGSLPIGTEEYDLLAESVRVFYHDWWQPLLGLAARNSRASVSLDVGDGRVYHIDRRLMRRWWRKRRTLGDLLCE